MSASDDPDTRQRLLEAAGQLFARQGYEGTSVRDICRQAQANIAAVNYYFHDKQRLYIEAVKSACQRQAAHAPLPQWPPGTPALAKLRDFIHTFIRRMVSTHEPVWERQLFLRELAQPTAACEELVRDHIRPQAGILAGILSELLPGVPEVQQRLTAFSIIGQCVFYRVATPILKALVGAEEYGTYDATLLAEHITRFTLAALGLGEATGPDRLGGPGGPGGPRGPRGRKRGRSERQSAHRG
jgi:AcrR family transcriptional regulator